MTNDMPSVIWVQRNKCSSDVLYNAWDTNDTAFCETKYVLSDEADELRRQRNVLYNVLSVVLELLDEHMQYTNAKVSTYQRLQDARRILAQYDKEMANDE